jgi:hypothetical protein
MSVCVCATEEEKVKQDDGLDQLIEKEESGNNVQEDGFIGSAWKNKAKAQQLTQEFFAILAILDITGSHNIYSSGILLLEINLDDKFVEDNLKLIGYILLVFAFYILIDGLVKSMNVFNPKSLPTLADLLLDWLIDLLSFLVIIPIFSAAGADVNYVLLVVVLVETSIVLFVTQKIVRKKIRIVLTVTISLSLIFGLYLAFSVAEVVEDELVTGTGGSFLNKSHQNKELKTPAGLKEAAIAMTCFILFVFFSIGGFCATVHYASHLGKMTFLGPQASKIFDFVFSSWLAVPFFVVVMTMSKCVELLHCFFQNLVDMYHGMADSKIGADGTIHFVCTEDDTDDEEEHIARNDNSVVLATGPDSMETL